MTASTHTTAPEPSLWQLIDAAHMLADGGSGVRFEVQRADQMTQAFVVQYDGQRFAYLNQCAHVAMELDWQPGVFFDLDKRFVMCASHGALYEPDTGQCVAGPCTGAQLTPVPLKHFEGHWYAARTI